MAIENSSLKVAYKTSVTSFLFNLLLHQFLG